MEVGKDTDNEQREYVLVNWLWESSSMSRKKTYTWNILAAPIQWSPLMWTRLGPPLTVPITEASIIHGQINWDAELLPVISHG